MPGEYLRRGAKRAWRWPLFMKLAPAAALCALAAALLINPAAALFTAGLVWLGARGVRERRRLRRERARTLSVIGRCTGSPSRLLPRGEAEWKDPQAVAAKTRTLLDLGFKLHGTFQHSMAPGQSYLILLKTEEGAGAALTEGGGGPAATLFSYYADGHCVGVSNSPDPWGVDLPGSLGLHRPQAPPEELYRLLLENREKDRLAPLTAESFGGQFERFDLIYYSWIKARLEDYYAPRLRSPCMPQEHP